MNNNPKWWKTPPYSNIVGGLGVALILWIVKTIYDWWEHTPVISTVGDWFKYIWNSLISFLSLRIPLWAVIGMFFWYFVLYWWLHIQKKKKLFSQYQDNTPKLGLVDENGELTDLGLLDAEGQNEAYRRKIDLMLEYTADKFDGIIWKWNWIHNNLINQYEAKHITPICPNPNCQNTPMVLVSTDFFDNDYYSCPECRHSMKIDPENKIKEKIILKKIAQS